MPEVGEELGDLAALRLGLHGVLPGQPRSASCWRAARWTGCRSSARSRSGSGCSPSASLIGGLAPSMPVLVAARFLQGLGGGALTPTAYVAIGRCLPERLQPRMFAMLSTAWVVPGIIGPVAGGRRGRAGRVALGVPGAPAAAGRGRRAGPQRAAPRARRRAARRGRRAAAGERPAPPRRSPRRGRGCRDCSSPAWVRPTRSCSSRARSSASRSSCRRTAGSPRRGRCASPRACRPPSSCAA